MPRAGWVDDLSISDGEVLWRRVPPQQAVKDHRTGRWRPSSAVFRPSDREMSVNMASLTTESAALAANPEDGLVAFTAGRARALDCIIVRQPEPDNPAHAIVVKKGSDTRLTKGDARILAEEAEWVKLPPSLQ